jgi:hypothetical protein
MPASHATLTAAAPLATAINATAPTAAARTAAAVLCRHSDGNNQFNCYIVEMVMN